MNAPSPDEVGRAMSAHDAIAREALATGDSDRIKRMYVDLGDELAEAVGDADAPGLAYPETARQVATMLAGEAGLHLDAGCGPNPDASFRVGELSGRAVVGVDIGVGMVRLARQMAERRGVAFLGVVADVERLPFRDGTFGSVVCDDTIEHLPDDRAGASELLRVARDDGRVVLATPNRRRLDVLAARLRDLLRGRRRPASDYFAAASHLREYTWRELEAVVAPVAEVEDRGWVPWAGGRRARLASAFTRTRLGLPFRRVVLLTLRPLPSRRGA